MTAALIVLALVSIDPNAGTAGFDFIRVAPTAREAALGGAAVGLANGPMSFWYNPAHVGEVEVSRAQLGYANYVAGIHYGSLAYSQPLNSDQGIGVGVVYMNAGTMKRTDPQGTELGTFGVSYADLNVSSSYRLSDFATVGFGLQGLYGSIDTFFTLALAANAGARVAVPIEGITGLSAGVAARNLGYQVKAFQTERDPMPVEFAAGLGFQPNPGLNLALDVIKSLDNRLLVRAGIEGWVADMLVLRAGYTSAGTDLTSGGGADILAGVTTGLGFRLQQYQLDYCFVPMVDLGMAHRLSFSLGL